MLSGMASRQLIVRAERERERLETIELGVVRCA